MFGADAEFPVAWIAIDIFKGNPASGKVMKVALRALLSCVSNEQRHWTTWMDRWWWVELAK